MRDANGPFRESKTFLLRTQAVEMIEEAGFDVV
jgi:hypothetical protein